MTLDLVWSFFVTKLSRKVCRVSLSFINIDGFFYDEDPIKTTSKDNIFLLFS